MRLEVSLRLADAIITTVLDTIYDDKMTKQTHTWIYAAMGAYTNYFLSPIRFHVIMH